MVHHSLSSVAVQWHSSGSSPTREKDFRRRHFLFSDLEEDHTCLYPGSIHMLEWSRANHRQEADSS